MRSVLQPEVAEIPAKISNQEVLQPQGHHGAWPEGGNSHLAFLHMSQRRPDSLHLIWKRREDHQCCVL